MCGIAGLIDKSERIGRTRVGVLAKAMADAMQHRGPDDAGVWVSADGRTGLSHRRLSIIDLSLAGHQPMAAADGCKQIVFNGEIYNFLELRSTLATAGHHFRTRTDTEVLLKLLERDGAAALDLLDGMFAFGLFDENCGELLLARDIFGEKPLYYMDTPDYFAFASELSALTLLPDFDARIDGSTIARFLAFQYVPAPETIYRSVRKLPPGCWLSRDAQGRLTVRRYRQFNTSSAAVSGRPMSDLADELEALLQESVRRRLVSDVPSGAFLSGGVDSSVVVAIASRIAAEPIKTFSIGFDGFAESEHLDAAEMARAIGTDHHQKLLRPDAVALADTIARALDEPNGDTSCLPTYLLSAFARERVTVALSGDGGDEMFGGYGRYFATEQEAHRKATEGGMEWWTPGVAYWSSRILVFPDDELALLTGAVPPELARELSDLRTSLDADTRPLINRLREVDAGHYMPGAVLAKVDRMSMQSSLEVRAPLLGRDLATFAANLAADDCYRGGQGKLVLKAVGRRYLPADWLERPKRGFGLPMGLWGAETLLPAARRLILSGDSRLAAWIPRLRLEAYLTRQAQEFSAYRTWSLLLLECWLRHHPHAVGEQSLQEPAVKRGSWSSILDTLRRAVRPTIRQLTRKL
ncbi:MAG: asparagine synthase (glutamine-hydrolyzing) [Cutibacterium sp.]|nr:asparagine synthase (glutamine-hydrolyzing) [Roseomonas sp.]MCA3775593.1 asparagine synthase (glutamine-hydrolyzing) [Cutibacterium sp.]